MDSTLIIFSAVALSAFTILCVTLAFVAVRASRSLEAITSTLNGVGTDIAEMKEQALPMIEEATSVLQRADSALLKIDSAVEHLSAGTSAIRGIADDARSLEREVVDSLRPSINEITNFVTGSLKGVTAFLKSLLQR